MLKSMYSLSLEEKMKPRTGLLRADSGFTLLGRKLTYGKVLNCGKQRSGNLGNWLNYLGLLTGNTDS